MSAFNPPFSTSIYYLASHRGETPSEPRIKPVPPTNTESIEQQRNNTMAAQHGDLGNLLPPTHKRMIAAWLEEDCPSFDYGGFVVGEVEGEARLLGKSKVRSPFLPMVIPGALSHNQDAYYSPGATFPYFYAYRPSVTPQEKGLKSQNLQLIPYHGWPPLFFFLNATRVLVCFNPSGSKTYLCNRRIQDA